MAESKLLKIVSGGQTGVDRGALDAALACGVECGGWCPPGRLAEDGTIPARYPVRELPSGGYAQRTRRNVVDSDATLIVFSGDIEGGTRLTLSCCQAARKPLCLIDAQRLSVTNAVEALRDFLAERDVAVLNVAGPRASKWPAGGAYAAELLLGVLGKAGRSP
jgi:hypothetical protein